MNERRRSAFLSVSFGYAGLALSLTRNILLVPIYLHSIPLAEYGAWLATGGALALIIINDYGLSGVVTQRMSAGYGAGRTQELGWLAGSGLAIGALLALGLSAISLVLVPFLPRLSDLTNEERAHIVSAFYLAIAANGLGVVGATAGSVLRSLQRATLVGSISLASELVNIGIVLIALQAGLGIFAIAVGVLCRSVILFCGGLVGVWLVCGRHLHTQIRVHLNTVRDLVGESSRFFLSSIALRLLSQANVFFISVILGSASAAVFSLTVRAHETGVSLVILISGALVPSMTHLFGSGNLARFRVVIMRTLIMLAMLTAFVMTLTVVLNSAFVSVWVGEHRFGGQAVSISMAAALFISLLSGVGYDALVAEGKFRLVTRYFLISSSLQVLLLCALLWAGLWMAPLVTIIVSLVYGLSFWKHVANDITMSARERKSLLFEILRIVVVSGSCALLFLGIYPKAGSWSALAIEGVLCGVTLLAGFLLCSWQLRRMMLEEVRATLRLFKVG